MALPLDPLPPVLVAEHPCGKAGGLDRIVRAERRPIDVAPRLGGAAAAALGLVHHLLCPLDPRCKLGRAQIYPPPRCGLSPIRAISRHHDRAPPVQALPVGREDGNADRENMAPQPPVALDQGMGLRSELLGPGVAQGSNAGPQQGAEVRLEQQFREPRRPQQLIGDAVRLGAALERTQVVEGVAAQNRRAVRGTGGGGVQGGDDVLAGRAPLQLHEHVLGDLFRSDVLHLPERGDRLELVAGKQTVLADVDVAPLTPPVPLVPIFTYAFVPAPLSASTRICTCRISCGVVSTRTCRSTASRSSFPSAASASRPSALWTMSW